MSDQLPELVTLVLPPDGARGIPQDAIALLESDVLPRFLPQQRWFADKDAAVGKVQLVDVVALDGDGMETYAVLVEITPSQRHYFVPLAVGTASSISAALPRGVLGRVRRTADDGFLYDALATDAFPRALLADVQAERRRNSTGGGGEIVAHATATFAAQDISAAVTVRRLNVEQSNTSVIVGETVMLKSYRRVHSGPAAELEVARFLDAVGYQNTPTLLGYVEYERPGCEPMALCILQRFVESQGDGWATTLTYLERFFDRNKPTDAALQVRTPTQTGRENAQLVDEHAQFLTQASMLGRRTAELHRAFATSTGDPAFEPEPTTGDDVAAWIAQARTTAESALDALARGLDAVPAALRDEAQMLIARRAEILGRMTIDPSGGTILKTRYHGDYHLGQVLVVGDDFMIVDFEGEPGRDPAVRRRKSSPLRDVAGMLRSINYAAVAAVRGVATDRGEDTTAFEPAARDWERRSAAAFLAGYRTTIAGCASYPGDPAQAQRLLELFVLEKAFYELSYELANRPAWLQIPLQGIRAILDADQHVFAAN